MKISKTEAEGKGREKRAGRLLKLAGAAVVATTLAATPLAAAQLCFRGINLAGAEFGTAASNEYGKDYIYPSPETIRHFAKRGFTSVRLPFLWERLQPELGKPFDEAELQRLTETLSVIRAEGVGTVLDPHNYGRYRYRLIGSSDVPHAAFADFWSRLAGLFADQPDISFGLMNEPHGLSAQDWLTSANAAAAAIRETGANNLILVPGTVWSGAHSWESDDYGGSNASVMLGFSDPGNNFAYEVHQYLDDDFSGTKGNCSRADDAVLALKDFTKWLRIHDRRGYLGEFGAPSGEQCIQGLAEMVDVVETNHDVWTGWAYWAAGDWWPEEEELNIQPRENGDRPQLLALQGALGNLSAAGTACLSLNR